MSVGCNDKYQQIFVLFKHHLVVLDTPEHEDDAADNTEDQGVGKVFVDRELDKVSSEPELTCGGHKGRENPPERHFIYNA